MASLNCKMNMKLIANIKPSISLWTAIKMRIAGFSNFEEISIETLGDCSIMKIHNNKPIIEEVNNGSR
jgi:hypothetical protein